MRRILWATAIGATAAVGCESPVLFDSHRAPLTAPENGSPTGADAAEPAPETSPPTGVDAMAEQGPDSTTAGLPDAGYVFVSTKPKQQSIYDTDDGLVPFDAACVLLWSTTNICAGKPNVIYRDSCAANHTAVYERYVFQRPNQAQAIPKQCVDQELPQLNYQVGTKRIDCAAACADKGSESGRCITMHSRSCSFVRPEEERVERVYVRPPSPGLCVCSGKGFVSFSDNGFQPEQPGCLRVDPNPQCMGDDLDRIQLFSEFCFSDSDREAPYGVITVADRKEPRGLVELSTVDWDATTQRFTPAPNGDGQCREYHRETRVDCEEFCDKSDDGERNRSRKGYCETVGTDSVPACVHRTKSLKTSAFCQCF